MSRFIERLRSNAGLLLLRPERCGFLPGELEKFYISERQKIWYGHTKFSEDPRIPGKRKYLENDGNYYYVGTYHVNPECCFVMNCEEVKLGSYNGPVLLHFGLIGGRPDEKNEKIIGNTKKNLNVLLREDYSESYAELLNTRQNGEINGDHDTKHQSSIGSSLDKIVYEALMEIMQQNASRLHLGDYNKVSVPTNDGRYEYIEEGRVEKEDETTYWGGEVSMFNSDSPLRKGDLVFRGSYKGIYRKVA